MSDFNKAPAGLVQQDQKANRKFTDSFNYDKDNKLNRSFIGSKAKKEEVKKIIPQKIKQEDMKDEDEETPLNSDYTESDQQIRE